VSAPRAGPGTDGAPRPALRTLYLGRFLGNWSLRFTYSFLPAIARGVGIPLETAGLVAGARELTGVTGPLLAHLIDRTQRRTAFAVSLVGLALGSVVAVIGGLTGFALGMIAAGVAKVAYDVASGAWIGDHVPFARRGRVTGLFETSWAAAFLIGVPLTAVLIDAFGWRSPFVLVAAAAAFVALLVPGVFAPEPPPTPPPASRHHLRPAAVAFYSMLFLLSLGPQLAFASYGAWFEDELGLGLEAIGLATIPLGLAELAASTGSAVLTDRLGKRRSVLVGLAFLVPSLAALGITEASTAAAVAVLALAFLGFEFALVSALPLASELDPDARTRTVGTSYAAMTAARAIGAACGVALYSSHGMAWTGAVGATIAVVAVVVLLVGVEEPDG